MAIRSYLRVSRVKLNDKTYLRDTKRAIQRIMKDAARVFLTTVLHHIKDAPHTSGGDTFPVQTGEAKASLIPLARLLNVALPISPATRGKTGKLRPNRVAEGKSKGKAFIGELNRNFIYKFDFQTAVRHFITNEDEFSPIPATATPWKAIAAGHAAAKKHIEENVDSLPKIKSYIIREKR